MNLTPALQLFIRSLERNEWQQFLRNAARVITILSLGSAQSESATIILRAARLGAPTSTNPFCRLRSLTFVKVDLELASYLPVVLSNSLRSIQLRSCSRTVVNIILGHVGHLCPRIQILSAIAIPPGASGVLLRLTSLRRLLCTRVEYTSTVLSHLSMLPTLEEMRVSLPDMHSITGIRSSTAFPSLKKLHLVVTTDYKPLTPLLRSVQSTLLLTLELSMHLPVLPDLVSMTELLAGISRFSTLQSLDITFYRDQDDNLVDYNILPLCALRDLRHVEIHNIPISMDNQSIHAFGKAWPNLEFLDFGPIASTVTVAYVTELTLEALALFATYFPKLGYLDIALDATAPPTTHLLPRSLKPIILRLERSPLDPRTWPDVAAYISAIYPMADGSWYRIYDDVGEVVENWGKKRWTDIARLVPIITGARREGEERAESLHAKEGQREEGQ